MFFRIGYHFDVTMRIIVKGGEAGEVLPVTCWLNTDYNLRTTWGEREGGYDEQEFHSR